MRLYRRKEGLLVEQSGHYYPLETGSLDDLVALDDLYLHLSSVVSSRTPADHARPLELLPPIGSQEVWAAGVTYYRSRAARIEESKDAGGGDFYDRVYSADRPELFFKSVARRVVGPDGEVRIRRDATWSVPEPELALLVNPHGKIIGYTIGNDMSSRDIEGVNPLYLPQAKVYDGSCALGPGILVQPDPMPVSTQIRMEILRAGIVEFSGSTALTEMKRDPRILVEYLFREQTFPDGCFLLTGTGIVPPEVFGLRSGDEIHISIDGIGTLMNQVA
jgi:2-dehydro-3-deoxy-D-arabinonate dehydratase